MNATAWTGRENENEKCVITGRVDYNKSSVVRQRETKAQENWNQVSADHIDEIYLCRASVRTNSPDKQNQVRLM